MFAFHLLVEIYISSAKLDDLEKRGISSAMGGLKVGHRKKLLGIIADDIIETWMVCWRTSARSSSEHVS